MYMFYTYVVKCTCTMPILISLKRKVYIYSCTKKARTVLADIYLILMTQHPHEANGKRPIQDHCKSKQSFLQTGKNQFQLIVSARGYTPLSMWLHYLQASSLNYFGHQIGFFVWGK